LRTPIFQLKPRWDRNKVEAVNARRNFIQTWLLVTTIWCESSSAFAQIWTQTSAPTTNWFSIACSADGMKLAAVVYNSPDPRLAATSPIYVSTNSGAIWTPTDPENFYNNLLDWTFIASSADGTKLVASQSDGSLNVSTDSGVTWTFSGSFNFDNAGWSAICSSADGSILAAADYGGPIYLSTNSGATWNATSASQSGQSWSSITTSADGSHIAATTVFDTIYVSTNSGMIWTASTAPLAIWQSIASSSDGKKMVAAAYNNGYGAYPGSIYTSTDSGMTWTVTSAPSNSWFSVASSADGNILVAAVWGGLIYTSTNSGSSWNAADAPSTNWQFVACSADGSKFFAGVNGGGIWTAQTTPTPQMNITPTNCNLTLSWIVPSTNFVLQKSCDLQIWAEMTNQPVLNLTNLQNQVILSPPGSNVFYRLKTP
jgi:hypothetical protein